MNKYDIRHADVAGKVVLVRVDINVPMKDGVVTDDTRITRILPTLQYLQEAGAKIVLLSHFGRPEGMHNEAMSLRLVMPALQTLLPNATVHFAADCIGDETKQAIGALKAGEIVLCENLRFHAAEEKGDAQFAAQLAALGDIYVNDAFSCSHRAHASISGIAAFLPSYYGLSMVEELDALQRVFHAPQKPVAALVGGSKVSTKMALLEHLVETMDIIMIGGGMANTFLYAQGHDVGKSLCEPDLQPLALSILHKAAKNNCRILLPTDVVAARQFAAHAECEIVPADDIPSDAMALDIGCASVQHWAEALQEVRTLVWNGPVGAFEIAPFDNATVSLARHIASLTRAGQLVCVAGGGDTVAALNHAGLSNAMSYLSTAGGAFLEWLEGKQLPGVHAIESMQKAVA
jgi:phosphoglycerate kinase